MAAALEQRISGAPPSAQTPIPLAQGNFRAQGPDWSSNARAAIAPRGTIPARSRRLSVRTEDDPKRTTLAFLYLCSLADARLGSVHLHKGNLHQALHLAQCWLQSCAVADLPMSQMVMASSLGEVLYVLNHIEEALTLHERAWQFAESKGIGEFGLSDWQHPEDGMRDAHLAAYLVHRGAELRLFEREGDVVFGELRLLHDMTSRPVGRKSCRKFHF